MSETLVLYQYFERDSVYRDNFAHFMAFGYRKDLDFLVILSGNHSIDLPQAPNIKYVSAPNRNYDYGAYSVALTSGLKLDNYKHVIFINSSVRGPYLPPLAQNQSWADYFIEGLTEDVALFGSTICILDKTYKHATLFRKRHPGYPSVTHVQTAAYAMTVETVKFLIGLGFYDNKLQLNRSKTITDYEILLSQTLLQAGKNISCLIPEYRDIDYRKTHSDFNPWSGNGDILHRDALLGRTVHPYETIFAKANRIMYPARFLDSLTFSLASAGQVNNAKSFQIVDEYLARINQLKKTYSVHLKEVNNRKRLTRRIARKVLRILRLS